MSSSSDSGTTTAAGRERNACLAVGAGGAVTEGEDSAGPQSADTAAQACPSRSSHSAGRPDESGAGDGVPAASRDGPAGPLAEPKVSQIDETDPKRTRTVERLRRLGIRQLTPEERAAKREQLQRGQAARGGVDPGIAEDDSKAGYADETGKEPPVTPPPATVDDAPLSPPREHLVSQAASFLSSPPVREAGIERQNAFLQKKKGLTAEETALARQKARDLPDRPSQKSSCDRPGMAASSAPSPPLPPRPLPPAAAYLASVAQPTEPPRAVTPRMSRQSLIVVIILAASACGGLAGLLQRLLNNAPGRIRRMLRVLHSSQYLRWSTFVGNVRALQALILPLPASVFDEQKKAAISRAEAVEDVARAMAADAARGRTAQEKVKNGAAVDPGQQQTRQVSTASEMSSLDHPPELAVSRLVSRTLPKCTLAILEFARRAEDVAATRKRVVLAIRSTKAAGGGLRRFLAAAGSSYGSPFYPGAGADSGGQGESANADRAHSEAIATLKDDIRGVKGVLLNARNFPSPFAPPG